MLLNMKKFYLCYPTQECMGGAMHLNPMKNATQAKTYAVIQRYMAGIVQHTQTPFVMEYEEL